MTDETSSKVVNIREAVSNANPPPRRRRPPKPREPRADDPATWPVKPLGMQGRTYWFQDAIGQVVGLKPNDLSRLGIKGLWGDKNHLLETVWPRYGRMKKGEARAPIDGPDYDAAASAHMSACAREGVWNPFGSVRGRGAWEGEAGELILHLGDAVMIGRNWYEPSVIGGFVYQAAKASPKPWDTPVAGGERSAAGQLLTILESWNWKRGKLDARLLLGWIGAAMLAGAIAWRPVVWVTGGRGTGKSTLHHFLERIFDGVLVAVSDASAAGIWQKLQHDSLPVVLDEVEAEEDPRKGQALLKLARQASSGGMVLRGGSDHGATEFTARSCFLFSSILVPALTGQDKSRMAILELNELGPGTPPDLTPRPLRELGQRLMRRLVDGWERWPETLAAYRDRLAAVAKHNARNADVFGTMLAIADLLLNDGEAHRDFIDALAEQLNVDSLEETDDNLSDQERCLQHVLTQVIPLDGGANKKPIAEWLRRADGLSPTEEEESGGATPHTQNEATQILGRYGLSVKIIGEAHMLAVASSHAELGKLFAGTHWAGRSGSVGVWTQALRRLDGAQKSGKKNVWFAGASAKATFLPLETVLPDPEPGDLPRTIAEAALFRDRRNRP